MWCYCRMVYLPMSYLYGKRFVGPITSLILQLRKELYLQPYEEINWMKVRHLCAKVRMLGCIVINFSLGFSFMEKNTETFLYFTLGRYILSPSTGSRVNMGQSLHLRGAFPWTLAI